MTDSYIYVITALLPLAALMVLLQVNPYHALVIRGILGAVAALVYTVLGAADVALTEALVGTLLAITLYAVAVRSSLVLRLGVLKEEAIRLSAPLDKIDSTQASNFKQLINNLRTIFSKHYMQVELIPYQELKDVQQALIDKEVHAICVPKELDDQNQSPLYHTTIRLRRLYEIMQTELESPLTPLTYFSEDSKEVR
jgi:putative multicomponent Na+:H+ antiporter subunit B